MNHYILLPELSGAAFLLAGLWSCRRAWSASSGLDRLVALGPALVAAAIATFGAEHVVGAQFVKEMVPPWMPARLFWAYFVGAALFATAVSLVARRHTRLSASLLATMLVLFVLLLHLPGAVAHPEDRFVRAVALRDLTFAACALAFGVTPAEGRRSDEGDRLVAVVRVVVGAVLVFFAIGHVLHPEFAPGVPLQKVTPDWMPVPRLWGYLTGLVELAAGAALVAGWRVRTAATWLALWLTALSVLFYGPVLAAARQGSEMAEGLNYLGDTLLLAGSMLFLAAASGREHADAAPRVALRA